MRGEVVTRENDTRWSRDRRNPTVVSFSVRGDQMDRWNRVLCVHKTPMNVLNSIMNRINYAVCIVLLLLTDRVILRFDRAAVPSTINTVGRSITSEQ